MAGRPAPTVQERCTRTTRTTGPQEVQGPHEQPTTAAKTSRKTHQKTARAHCRSCLRNRSFPRFEKYFLKPQLNYGYLQKCLHHSRTNRLYRYDSKSISFNGMSLATHTPRRNSDFIRFDKRDTRAVSKIVLLFFCLRNYFSVCVFRKVYEEK